ncbi:MAG: hypothetical protein J2P17_19025, partial [Mycobacterium sp.]|nr:hypothetical protein [Mycobacterium sp.]
MTSNRIQQNVQGGDWGGASWYQVWQDDIEKVKSMLQKMRPEDVDTASGAYSRVSSRIYESVQLLYDQAGKMSQSWSGEAAQGAMRQMQAAYDDGYEIYDKSSQTSAAMSSHAEMMRSYKSNPPEPAGGGGFMGGVVNVVSAVSPGVAVGAREVSNHNADEFMNNLQNDTVESNTRFPRSIQSDMSMAGNNIENYNPNTGNPGTTGGGSLPPGGVGGGAGGGGSVGG